MINTIARVLSRTRLKLNRRWPARPVERRRLRRRKSSVPATFHAPIQKVDVPAWAT